MYVSIPFLEHFWTERVERQVYIHKYSLIMTAANGSFLCPSPPLVHWWLDGLLLMVWNTKPAGKVAIKLIFNRFMTHPLGSGTSEWHQSWNLNTFHITPDPEPTEGESCLKEVERLQKKKRSEGLVFQSLLPLKTPAFLISMGFGSNNVAMGNGDKVSQRWFDFVALINCNVTADCFPFAGN